MMEITAEQKAFNKAFANFQANVGGVEKDGENSYLKSKYATIESILSVLRPALSANGLSFSQSIESIENGYRVSTVVRHEEGYCEVIKFDAIVPPVKDAQAMGSLTTYLKRYSLVSAFGLSTEDDDGQSASASQIHQENVKQEKAKALNADAVVKALMNAKDIELLNQYFNNAKKRADENQMKRIQKAYDQKKEELGA